MSTSSPFTKTYIPYGAYWSTPFARWQGAFANLHSLKFAAHIASDALRKRSIDAAQIDFGVLGTTIPQTHCFYGLPWVTGLMGAAHVGGPTINQACATSARVLATAADEVERGDSQCALLLAADRTSNGPHLYYPNPSAPGGTGQHENWVMDNFSCDPFANVAMVTTAENVATEYEISTAEQHDVALLRAQQYGHARDTGFHARYMQLPFAVPDARFQHTVQELHGDEGIHATSAAALAALKPVIKGGTVTFGGQTHPADGNAGALVVNRARISEFSSKPEIGIRILGIGQARTDVAHMPKAPVPAANRALTQAGISIDQVSTVTTHNPFAVNDVIFARETGFPLARMNRHGCSLIWGHPQGPTGLRAIIELIETLVMDGGGIGLFTGCAAGDTAMAVVLCVEDL